MTNISTEKTSQQNKDSSATRVSQKHRDNRKNFLDTFISSPRSSEADRMAKPFTFTANTESVNEVYNNSLFKNLFKQRNTLLLDKTFPKTEKGLALPELSQRIGAATYSFKLNDVADKVTVKTGDKEVVAKYKKDTKKFDISVKQKMATGVSMLVKYEERGGEQKYVFGVAYTAKGLMGLSSVDLDAKFNPFTGNLKASTMMDIAAGVQAAADLKVNKNDMKPLFNAGILYKSPFGSTNVSYSHKAKMITVSQFMDSLPIKGMCCAVEYVQGLEKAPKCPVAVGAGYKIDAEHTIKARVNKDMGVQVLLEKELAKGCSFLFATAFDLKNPASMNPSFGVKVVAK